MQVKIHYRMSKEGMVIAALLVESGIRQMGYPFPHTVHGLYIQKRHQDAAQLPQSMVHPLKNAEKALAPSTQ